MFGAGVSLEPQMNYALCAALILERGVEGKLVAPGSPVPIAIPKTRMDHGPEFILAVLAV